jgi:hypothetical protein
MVPERLTTCGVQFAESQVSARPLSYLRGLATAPYFLAPSKPSTAERPASVSRWSTVSSQTSSSRSPALAHGPGSTTSRELEERLEAIAEDIAERT